MVPDSHDGRGCPKCGQTETEVGTISTTGGGLSKMFDIQTNSFKVVSCTNCGYSELYRASTSGASDIIDVFLGQMVGGIVLLVVLLAIVGPILLYYFVRSEHDRRGIMDRDEAERTARRDSNEIK